MTTATGPEDRDPQETGEWLDSVDAVIHNDGPGRAAELLDGVLVHATRRGVPLHFNGETPYINTIPANDGAEIPFDQDIEHKLRSLVRWNALSMVLQANKESSELGGHIASYQSAATTCRAFERTSKRRNSFPLGDRSQARRPNRPWRRGTRPETRPQRSLSLRLWKTL